MPHRCAGGHELDLLVEYGGLLIHADSLDQIIATGAAQKFTLWASNAVMGGEVVAEQANDRIVVGVAGDYMVDLHMAFNTSSGAWWTGHIYLDGVDTGIDWDRNVLAATRPGSVSCGAPLVIPARGVVEVYLSHDQGGDITFTVLSAQLNVARVG